MQIRSYSQDLLAGPPQQDGAGFGVFTLGDKREILVPDLLNLKQSGSRTHVFLTQLISPADNTSPTRPEGHAGNCFTGNLQVTRQRAQGTRT